ncbi:MAG TPA: hypothetical protein VGT44_21690, partial [Ktedonobacteraceae bacterium]|nr:hypothetical protein [Ktedonobacteraceae bacterium]
MGRFQGVNGTALHKVGAGQGLGEIALAILPRADVHFLREGTRNEQNNILYLLTRNMLAHFCPDIGQQQTGN